MSAQSAKRLADRKRAERLRADRALRADLLGYYADAWERIRSQLDTLADEIDSARARGETVNRSWLARRGRLESLQQQVEAEMRVVVDLAERRITDARADNLLAGRLDALDLLRESLGPPPPGAFQPALPVPQVERLAAASRSGEPLGELLGRLGPKAAADARRALVVGLAVGKGPREIARDLRTSLGGNAARALTIARTEVLGAYRSVALETYRESGVATGWIWVAQLSHRTCPVCWAMHGSEHAPDEPFGSHPNCRCAPIPRTKSWAELGVPGVRETSARVESGPDVFARSEEPLQRAVLGPAKLAAYQRGDLRLEDLVVETRSPFGPGRREASLRDALGVAA